MWYVRLCVPPNKVHVVAANQCSHVRSRTVAAYAQVQPSFRQSLDFTLLRASFCCNGIEEKNLAIASRGSGR